MSYRIGPRKYVTFESAEKSARRLHVKSRREPVDIHDDQSFSPVPAATIRSDGLGRVWTDVTGAGTELL